ncbi:biosynthetic peptidoglycan transglycosylase [Coprococcus sp. AF21-14LB]|uniref:biosynthetic peptidoglycan transglycosylase n=1 Tax=Coprococcus sp. AF21-14LB TaxID=2292231 RepID=UPI000E506200|nr:biosynthetic peptidoglycan transglycosylase [Coprococcus sp. AF21-14LB]QUO31870.1 transglycosylase domain-containing protein [Faecalicatena sp. Marseille-Q4148]RGS79682.1 glycosyl transferase [Coprococcus sp. AF21-14LB]
MKLLKKLLAFMILLFLLACGYLGYKGYQEYETALSAMSMEEMEQKIQSIGNYTKLEDLPETYVKAVLAVEDKRFYRHFGIDLIATCRALVNDIKAMAPVEGGSTITQQLAKNQYFSQEKKVTRKIAELFMAFKMEQSFTKDQILEMYVNSIFFGNNYYCVGDASIGYFGKLPAQMNDDECTMLAGIPNAPSVYNPVVNPELARQRQQQVIRKMERCGDVFQGRR